NPDGIPGAAIAMRNAWPNRADVNGAVGPTDLDFHVVQVSPLGRILGSVDLHVIVVPAGDLDGSVEIFKRERPARLEGVRLMKVGFEAVRRTPVAEIGVAGAQRQQAGC